MSSPFLNTSPSTKPLSKFSKSQYALGNGQPPRLDFVALQDKILYGISVMSLTSCVEQSL